MTPKSTPSTPSTPATAHRIADAATQFLASLAGDQRDTATFPFDGDERFTWSYRPGARHGLRLKDMSAPQRETALGLLDGALSERGAREARQVIALEPILGETERLEHRISGFARDPDLYYFSIFGQPGGPGPWAWRASGHHLGLQFTVVDGALVSPTPLFFGASPAQVNVGPAKGQRTLAAEEDLARTFLGALDQGQKAAAIVDPTAPTDILTANYRTADPKVLPAHGVAYAALSGRQREQLVGLIRHYVERVADELAANAWARIEAAGLEGITFAWAGTEAPGQAHYYVIKGPTLLIEYDNSRNDANHIHSVWRDFADDWDADVLASHYHTVKRNSSP